MFRKVLVPICLSLLVSATPLAVRAGYVDDYPELFLFTAPPAETGAPVPRYTPGKTVFLASMGTAARDLLNALGPDWTAAEGRIVFLHQGEQEAAQQVTFLEDNGFSPALFGFLDVTHRDTDKVGDAFPIVMETEGGVRFVDPKYDPGRKRDDAVGSRVATELGACVHRPPVLLHQGLVDFTSQGLCVVSSRFQTLNQSFSWDQLTVFLARYLGCKKVVSLQPLIGDAAGRLDVFFRFTSDEAALLASYEVAQDSANRLVLDNNAAKLAGEFGSTVTVHRIAMPSPSGVLFPSYLPYRLLEDRVLVPRFPLDDQREESAYSMIRAAHPGLELHPFLAGSLMQTGTHLTMLFAVLPQVAVDGVCAGDPPTGPDLLCDSYDLSACPDLCFDACLQPEARCVSESTLYECEATDDGCLGRKETSCPLQWTCQVDRCVAPPGPCVGMPPGGRCVGDVVQTCHGDQLVTKDCAAEGKVCLFDESNQAKCGFWCTDTCQAGDKRCGLDETVVERCLQAGSGCLDWSSIPCGADELCRDDECQPRIPDPDDTDLTAPDGEPPDAQDVGFNAGFRRDDGCAPGGRSGDASGLLALLSLLGAAWLVTRRHILWRMP
jgi:hypothetical protein